MFNIFSNKAIQDIEQSSEVFTVDTHDSMELYSYIETKSGIELDINKPIIKQKIIDYCKKHNIKSFATLLNKIKIDEFFFKRFVTLITINETYFFREAEQIKNALYVYKKQNSSCLDILCLPSSTGEEVYSTIIIALEMHLNNFRVVGVDIDQVVIQKAREGIYNERSVHRIEEDILEKYFTIKNNNYNIKESIKKYAIFTQCNLFEESLSTIGKFDIIFSRNMFIYFNDAKKILAYKQLEKLKKYNDTKIYLGHADISSSLDNYIRRQK
ncbi:hypothetical protein FJR45_05290 [Sulfurimonas sediminis]|uniref:CheR-type methyltransferase domain-containing protein n=1 Tax=Sulfurimonas sediminis TaxID=2590020 RepID=A0A7M1B0V3_9BACT|nr:CheR family methyltransferase [Sulfurimonas sediminis]QOP43397.1 hypothetical protein FJR45_05290 [Sulfurimonas sediminis]